MQIDKGEHERLCRGKMPAIQTAVITFIADNIGWVLLISIVIVFALGAFSIQWTTLRKDVFTLKKDVPTLLDKFYNLDTKVEKISGQLNLIIGLFPAAKIAANTSPSRLTDFGKEIAQSINATSIVQKYLSDLKEENPEYKDLNAYKIQVACMDFALNKLIGKLDKTEVERLETEAFNRGMKIEDILRVLGYVFRDALLDEMGIPIDHVDKHDPNAENE